MLDKRELKDFKMSLNEYIDYGIDNAFSQKWIKELENASARVHIDRLEQLKISLQAEAIRLFGIEDKTLIDSIKKAYNERYNQNNYIVQKGLGIGFDIVDINQDKLDKLIVKPWANDGRNFSNRLWQSKEQMVNNLYNQTVRLSLGGSLKDAIDSMTRYVGREIKNKKYAAQRLIQTEMSYFTSEAQKESYKELGLDKYEIVATLDNKTSSICQEMDGKVYDMKAYQSGVTAPPFHPNCRSTTCPYFDDEFTVGEMRKAKDILGNTYKVPADMTYKEWKAKQDDLKNDRTDNTKLDKNQLKNEEPKEIRFNDITDKWTEKTKEGSYAECESITINGKTYRVGDNGVVLNLNNRSDEVEIAKALAEKYGKEAVILPEISGNNRYIHMADLMVNGKPVEIKTLSASGHNTIKNAIKRAKGQANDIIINIGKTELTTEEIIDTIQKQFNNPQCRHMENCIIMKNGEILKVFEQKKLVGTSAMLKHDVIPTIGDITIKSLKSQLQNDKKDDKIYIRKAEVVEGQDLVGKIKYKGLLKPKFRGDPNKLYAIDEIVEKQGFNGLPTIINSEEELKKLTNADTLLGERTIRAKDEDLFNQYCNDLLNDRFYINCAVGGAQYGQGMYFCGDYTKGKISANKWQHEIDQYAGKAPFKKTYWLTLQKNIKSIEDNKIKQEYFKKIIGKDELSREEKIIFDRFTGRTTILTKRMVSEWFDDIKEKYKQEGKLEQLLELQKSMRKDLGVMAAEMGYDMIEAKGHGTTGSYNVLLNRTKLIIIDKDIKAETIENIFGGNGIEK